MKSFYRLFLLSAALCLLLQGCVYRIDVQQGNEITAEMLNRLEVGMSKEEVIEVLGLPLVNDPFHLDRWDYYFYLKKGKGGEVEQRSATLRFSEGVLSGMDSTLVDEAETETETESESE